MELLDHKKYWQSANLDFYVGPIASAYKMQFADGNSNSNSTRNNIDRNFGTQRKGLSIPINVGGAVLSEVLLGRKQRVTARVKKY